MISSDCCAALLLLFRLNILRHRQRIKPAIHRVNLNFVFLGAIMRNIGQKMAFQGPSGFDSEAILLGLSMIKGKRLHRVAKLRLKMYGPLTSA